MRSGIDKRAMTLLASGHLGTDFANGTLPALLPLILKGHPRPVTPYYLMLSTTLQPEFSAALVGRKSPERAIRDGKAQVEHLQQALSR